MKNRSFSQFMQVFAMVLIVMFSACCNKDSKEKGTVTLEDSVQLSSNKFLNLSDVHFDPYYDTSLIDRLNQSPFTEWEAIFESSTKKKLAVYHHDSNYPLLKSSLDAMKSKLPNPDFLLITGDFMAHEFESKFEEYAGVSHSQDSSEGWTPLRGFVTKTMKFLSAQIEKRFPNAPVYAALGNNDAYCGDYMVQPGGPYLKMLQEVWKSDLHSENTGTFDQTFPKGGYYSLPAKFNPKVRMIVLNTILLVPTFNRYYEYFCSPGTYGPDETVPGKEMMTWFRQQMEECRTKGEKAWVLQHIPPGVNVYNTIPSSGSCIKDSSIFMTEPFNLEYLKAIRDYKDVIAANFAGHYHKDDFRLIMDEEGGDVASFIHVLPAISPIYFNNPGFEVVSYDPETANMTDYTAWYVNVADQNGGAVWKDEYMYSSSFPIGGDITAENLLKLHNKLETDSTMRGNYVRQYPVEYKPGYEADMKKFKYYWCGQIAMTMKDFASCVCEN